MAYKAKFYEMVVLVRDSDTGDLLAMRVRPHEMTIKTEAIDDGMFGDMRSWPERSFVRIYGEMLNGQWQRWDGGMPRGAPDELPAPPAILPDSPKLLRP